MPKKIARRAITSGRQGQPPTVWEALNESVVEVPENFARAMVMIAVIMLMVAWVAPYWGVAGTRLPDISYNSPIITGEGLVAGAQVTNPPVWYSLAKTLPFDFANAFAFAADEVLDVSEPASQMAEFYGPGFQALNNAWLELMADPY